MGASLPPEAPGTLIIFSWMYDIGEENGKGH
jgi:hypothetical protein